SRPPRRAPDARLMRGLLLLLVVGAIVVLLLTRAEPLAPTVALETPVDFVGRATSLRVVARDRGTGLAWVQVRVVPGGGEPVVLARQTFPPGTRWLGLQGGTHEATLTPKVDATAAHLTEGPATPPATCGRSCSAPTSVPAASPRRAFPSPTTSSRARCRSCCTRTVSTSPGISSPAISG